MAKLLITIDGYAENKDPSIVHRLDRIFTDPEMIADVLRYWPSSYHYSALLYLRRRGFEAWAENDDVGRTQNYTYRKSSMDEFIKIVPLHKRDMAHLDKMIEVWTK